MCPVRDMMAGLLGQAQAAFTAGFAGAAAVNALGIAILAAFAALGLQHVRRLDPTQGQER